MPVQNRQFPSLDGKQNIFRNWKIAHSIQCANIVQQAEAIFRVFPDILRPPALPSHNSYI